MSIEEGFRFWEWGQKKRGLSLVSSAKLGKGMGQPQLGVRAGENKTDDGPAPLVRTTSGRNVVLLVLIS